MPAYSPGLVCIYFVLNQLFKESDEIREIDFLSNYEYIQRWTNLQRSRNLLTIYRGDFLGRIFQNLRVYLHRVRVLNFS